MADNDPRTERLARIDAKIAQHRELYLRACWVGHDGEAEEHEHEIDRLLGLRNYVTRDRPMRDT